MVRPSCFLRRLKRSAWQDRQNHSVRDYRALVRAKLKQSLTIPR